MRKKPGMLILLFFLAMLLAVPVSAAGTKSSASAAAAGVKKWKTLSNGKIRYYNTSTKKYVKNKWKKIDGKWYYFDKNGYLQLNRFKVGANYYYATFKAGRYTNRRAGNYYYGSNGAMVKNCWQKISGKYYYFGANGKVRFGQFQVGKKTYYCTKAAGRVTNTRVGDYYYNAKGLMVRNAWVGNFYYGNDGKAVYGPLVLKGKTYYIKKKTGKVKNTWYKNRYLDEDGVMATNQWLAKDGGIVYVNGKGKITKVNKDMREPPTEENIRLLAALVYYESGNQPYEGKLAVASVVINRLNDDRFPNTLYEVIYQSGQFTPAMNGSVTWLNASGQKIQADCVKAAKEVMTGGTKYPDYYYFNNTYIYGWDMQIGDHYFSKVYG